MLRVFRWVDLVHRTNVAILRDRYAAMQINFEFQTNGDRGFACFGRLSFAGSQGSDYALRATYQDRRSGEHDVSNAKRENSYDSSARADSREHADVCFGDIRPFSI